MYYVNCVIQDVDFVAITDSRWPFKTPCLTYGLRYMYRVMVVGAKCVSAVDLLK